MVICPTLWRRRKVEALIDSWASVPHGPDTHLALITDRADPSYDGLTLPPGVRIWAPVSQDLASTAEKTNAAAAGFAPAYRALMSTGDDAHFLTPDWDAKLLEPIEHSPGFTYPDMDLREVTVPGIVVISSPIVRALGWMFLPTIRHYYADNVWEHLGKATDSLTFVPEAVFHDAYGPHDGTYARAQDSAAADLNEFDRWRASDQSGRDADTIRRVIKTFSHDWSC